MAGPDWFRNFLLRNNLSLRKSRQTSKARATGFNKDALDEFFSLLNEIYNEYKFQASNIYNVDKTGFTLNPKMLLLLLKRGENKLEVW